MSLCFGEMLHNCKSTMQVFKWSHDSFLGKCSPEHTDSCQKGWQPLVSSCMHFLSLLYLFSVKSRSKTGATVVKEVLSRHEYNIPSERKWRGSRRRCKIEKLGLIASNTVLEEGKARQIYLHSIIQTQGNSKWFTEAYKYIKNNTFKFHFKDNKNKKWKQAHEQNKSKQISSYRKTSYASKLLESTQ